MEFRPRIALVLVACTILPSRLVISRVDDPDTDHSFKIELTATRVKDKL